MRFWRMAFFKCDFEVIEEWLDLRKASFPDVISPLGYLSITLTHYSPVLLFYTPWKHQGTFSFQGV